MLWHSFHLDCQKTLWSMYAFPKQSQRGISSSHDEWTLCLMAKCRQDVLLSSSVRATTGLCVDFAQEEANVTFPPVG